MITFSFCGNVLIKDLDFRPLLNLCLVWNGFYWNKSLLPKPASARAPPFEQFPVQNEKSRPPAGRQYELLTTTVKIWLVSSVSHAAPLIFTSCWAEQRLLFPCQRGVPHPPISPSLFLSPSHPFVYPCFPAHLPLLPVCTSQVFSPGSRRRCGFAQFIILTDTDLHCSCVRDC